LTMFLSGMGISGNFKVEAPGGTYPRTAGPTELRFLANDT
jgi:hypothetical protein